MAFQTLVAVASRAPGTNLNFGPVAVPAARTQVQIRADWGAGQASDPTSQVVVNYLLSYDGGVTYPPDFGASVTFPAGATGRNGGAPLDVVNVPQSPYPTHVKGSVQVQGSNAVNFGLSGQIV